MKQERKGEGRGVKQESKGGEGRSEKEEERGEG